MAPHVLQLSEPARAPAWLVGALAALLVASGRAQARGQEGGFPCDVRAELARLLEVEGEPRERALTKLVERERGCLAPLVTLALDGGLPAELEAQAAGPNQELRWRTLVIEALGRAELDLVLEQIDEALALDARTERMLRATEVLGALGRAGSLAYLLEIGRSALAEQDPEASAHGVVARAVEQVLSRDAGALEVLEFRWHSLDPCLRPALALALERVPSPQGMALLASVLGDDAAHDAVLLKSILGAARSAGGWLAEPGLAEVREYLTHADPALQLLAVLTLTHLGDEPAFRSLVELLDHSDERLRGSAWQALQSLSKITLPPEREPWLAWYKSECGWLDSEGRLLRRSLASPRPAVVVRAISALGEHPLFAAELAPELFPLLWNARIEVARAACAGLVRLSSARAIEELREVCEQGPAALRPAAEQALSQMGAMPPALESDDQRTAASR